MKYPSYKKTSLLFVFLLFFSTVKATEPEAIPSAAESLLQSPYLCQSVNVITGDYCEAATDFANPSDPSLKIRRSFSNNEGWHFNLPLIQIAAPDHPDSPFSYNYDSKGRLSSVNKNNSTTPSIKINYTEQPPFGMALQINRTSLSYEFETPDLRLGIPPFQIKRISSNDTELCRYSYVPHPSLRKQLVERKDECNGNFLINEYYDRKNNQVGDATVVIEDPVRDPMIGRVKLQKGPVGLDQTPIITARYFYHPGYTEVYDALNRKTVYRYQADRITATEYYNDGVLYRTERLFWEKVKDKEIWNLTAKSWNDSVGNTIKCQTFTFDAEGNQTSETLYGTLTGKDTPMPVIDDKGYVRQNGAESYTIRRDYTESETSRFITESHGNGKVITHIYDKATKLKTAEFTGNSSSFLKRCFFIYNDDRQLSATYIDNGSSPNINDLHSVTERYATIFTYGTSSALPEIKEEKFLDMHSGCFTTSRRTLCTYNDQGCLATKKIFDGENTLLISTTYAYDSFGRLTKELDSNGSGFIKTYDALGNLLEETLIENHNALQKIGRAHV